MQIFDEKKLPDSDTYYIEENIYQKSPDSESNSTLPTSVCTSIQSHTNSLETVTLCRHSCLGLPHTNTFQPSYFGNCS